jgi:hypothetical protein
MNKNLDLKIVLDAIHGVQEQFYDLGSDMLSKISLYWDTHRMSGYAGDPSFDYAKFLEVMKEGFNSLTLKLMFESLLYLHYFYDVQDQMKKYLNQSTTAYFGNSILDDLDPVTLITNPWFIADVAFNEIKFYQRSNPAYFIHFHLCGSVQHAKVRANFCLAHDDV